MNTTKELANYLIENAIQIKQAMIIAIAFSLPATVIDSFTNWYISNNTYLTIILGTIAIDHLFGTIVHLFYKRDFSIKKNLIGVSIKIFVVILMGLLFEALSHLTAESDIIFRYLRMTLRLIVFSYPFRSTMRNVYILTGERFPPKVLIDNFENFNKTMNTSEIIKKDELETFRENQ